MHRSLEGAQALTCARISPSLLCCFAAAALCLSAFCALCTFVHVADNSGGRARAPNSEQRTPRVVRRPFCARARVLQSASISIWEILHTYIYNARARGSTGLPPPIRRLKVTLQIYIVCKSVDNIEKITHDNHTESCRMRMVETAHKNTRHKKYTAMMISARSLRPNALPNMCYHHIGDRVACVCCVL